MNKIVLVEKYNPSSLFWPYLLKNIKIPNLSPEEIINMYQGFEGELILISDINESFINFNEAMDQALNVKKANDQRLIYVISNPGANLPILLERTLKCGYDVGICEQDKTIYSSIFNEILFGQLPELIAYKNYLNENLLFQSRALAEKYVDAHQQLSIQGKGVEDYEEMVVYEIRKEKN